MFFSLIICISISYLTVEYNIYSQGLVIPAKEWTLLRGSDGNFITAFKDNVKGVNTSFNVTEFNRGDVVDFRLSSDFLKDSKVEKGDTIGYVDSNEEQRRLKELEDDLHVLNSELLFSTTGQKQEDIDISNERLKQAKADFETERLLFDRNLRLFRDTVLTKQEIEIFENNLKIKELEVSIRDAEYRSVMTGEKIEQEILINSKIRLVENQIDKIKERLNNFLILAPFDGELIQNSVDVSGFMKLSIYENNNMVSIIPIDIFDKQYLKTDFQVNLYFRSINKNISADILKIDNVIHRINQKQVFFITTTFSSDELNHVGELSEVKVYGDKVTIWEFLKRLLFKTISK